MGGVNGLIAIFCGYILTLIKKINTYCIKRYNTYKFQKYNPELLFIGADVKCDNPKNIVIGKNSYINGGMLCASDGKIVIGDNCMISFNVHIRTDMHIHDSIEIPMIKQGVSSKDIVIGDDVWIGFGVQIMPGVHIADGCIIGAGAVVTHDCEPYSVYGGVPAKLINRRK